MSIIHDALKKAQQSLNQKAEGTKDPVPPENPKTSGSIFEDPPPPVEVLPSSRTEPLNQKPPIRNKFKAILALICAITITAGALLYIYQQYQNNFPKLQIFVREHIIIPFNHLIHKPGAPDLRTKAPEPLGPLAKITVPSQATVIKTSASNVTVTPSKAPIVAAPIIPVPPPAPEILNIHGVMSNGANNVVLIADQVYQEGDEVDGAKIVKINLDEITVIIDGKEEKIRVKD